MGLSSLVRRYKESAETKPPARILSLVKRTVSSSPPDYKHLPGTESPHLFTVKSDLKFSITLADLKTLIRNGLNRIQVNDPGKITLYFSEEEATKTASVDFEQLGEEAYRKGLSSMPAKDPALMKALKEVSGPLGSGVVMKAMKEWTKGWTKAHLRAT